MRLTGLVLAFAAGALCGTDWATPAADAAGTRYSKLKQINTKNVGKLQLAWKYDTGDSYRGSELQCNPIIVDGIVYTATPKLRIIALDGVTGKLIWSFDPNNGAAPRGKLRNRGLMYWSSGEDRRLYFAYGPYFTALNAKTGKLIPGFGNEGKVDLREGLGRDPKTLNVGLNSPGAVYKDLLIVGSIVSEGLPSAPGDIRAYDARTGALRWTFHTVPRPGEFGYETWPPEAWKYTGGANSWPGLALDEKRGLVFVPTGSASFDFYGANRHGDNLFANSLLALKADTGERVWHFQFVRHDVWDRDLPSAPSLVTVRRNGKTIDAVAQITKSGHVFVFERETGKSLFPIQYVDAAPSPVDGELLAKQQPLPTKPEPFARQSFTEELVTNRTPEAHRIVLERLRKVRSGPQFTPPSLEGSIVFPGFDGGGEWGGPAFDPETGLFYVNSNEMAWILRIVPRKVSKGQVSGKTLYTQNCAGCHREDLGGSPPEFPSLKNLAASRTQDQVDSVIRRGVGRMPAFAHLKEPGIEAILRYLLKGEDVPVVTSAAAPSPIEQKYDIDGYNKFLDPDGYPAVTPPWGTLNAINLNTGEYAWKIPFGEFPELVAKGIRNTGSENYGGGAVTAGGLLFIGATNHDRKFRAYDKSNGKLLWETTLDVSANATPSVYEVNGRQFVIVGAGGGKSGAPVGGTYYTFALPEK